MLHDYFIAFFLKIMMSRTSSDVNSDTLDHATVDSLLSCFQGKSVDT